MDAEIEVKRRDAEQAGRCNACWRDCQRVPYQVIEVALKTISFRLCDDCAFQLMGKLEDIVKL